MAAQVFFYNARRKQAGFAHVIALLVIVFLLIGGFFALKYLGQQKTLRSHAGGGAPLSMTVSGQVVIPPGYTSAQPFTLTARTLSPTCKDPDDQYGNPFSAGHVYFWNPPGGVFNLDRLGIHTNCSGAAIYFQISGSGGYLQDAGYASNNNQSCLPMNGTYSAPFPAVIGSTITAGGKKDISCAQAPTPTSNVSPTPPFSPTPQPVGYTVDLMPSATITMPVSTATSGYGISVVLKNNGSVVTDQHDIKYSWSSEDASIVTVSPWAPNPCTYGIQPPCPQNHADLKGLKPGKTRVNVTITKIVLDPRPIARGGPTPEMLIGTYNFMVTVGGSSTPPPTPQALGLNVKTSCMNGTPRVEFTWEAPTKNSRYAIHISNKPWTSNNSVPKGAVTAVEDPLYAKTLTWDNTAPLRDFNGGLAKTLVPQPNTTYWWRIWTEYGTWYYPPYSTALPGQPFTTPQCNSPEAMIFITDKDNNTVKQVRVGNGINISLSIPLTNNISYSIEKNNLANGKQVLSSEKPITSNNKTTWILKALNPGNPQFYVTQCRYSFRGICLQRQTLFRVNLQVLGK